MKTVIFVIIILPALLIAQSLSKEGSIRIYSYRGTWATGATYMFYDKDTIYGGHQVSKYSIYAYWSSNNFNFSYGKIEDYFLLDSSGLIIKLRTINGKLDADTIINFNLSNGDRVEYSHFSDNNMVHYCHNNFNYKTPQKILRSKSLLFWLSRDELARRMDTLIEGIGYIKDFLDPNDHYWRQVDGGIGGPLLCYFDPKLGWLKFNSGQAYFSNKSCVELMKFVKTENINTNIFRTYLNSTNGSWVVESSMDVVLKIYSIQGYFIKDFLVKEGKSPLPIDNLEPGLFLIGNKTLGYQKIIKF